MAILDEDVLLMASERLADTTDGGGAMTGVEIIPNQHNAMFPDVSDLDRTYGRLNLRKAFLSVDTPNVDVYYGAHAIVLEPPQDPNISITLFSTGDYFDQRSNAVGRVEAYLFTGSEISGYLLEDHIKGQKAITLFQRVNSLLPTVGQTVVLVGPGGTNIQYVRIISVETLERTFSYDAGGGNIQDYRAWVVTCGISDALRYDFAGSPPYRLFTRNATKTQIKDTRVADAANYYGISKVVADAPFGQLFAKVDSVYTRLVPSAQTEVSLPNVTAAGVGSVYVDSSSAVQTYSTSVAISAGSSIWLGGSVLPGSISVSGGATLTDKDGQLFSGTTPVATVDYAAGKIDFASTSPTYSGAKTFTFRGAAAPTQVTDTAAIAVTEATRAYNYNLTLATNPSPGSLVVSYRVQGKWYDLKDTGSGKLAGADTSYGVGTLSQITNTVSVTLGALPDAGSQIIFSWGSKANYFNRTAIAATSVEIPMMLAHEGITPGSVVITWNDGTARTATDNGSGAFTGSATGTINYATGEIILNPGFLPLAANQLSIAYTWGEPTQQDFPAPARNGNGTVSLSLSSTNIKPKTVELQWNVLIDMYDGISKTPRNIQFGWRVDPYKTVRDDGAGNMKDSSGVSFGTINYATGVITVNPDFVANIPVPQYTSQVIGIQQSPVSGEPAYPLYRNVFTGIGYQPAAHMHPVDETAWMKVKYRSTNSDNSVPAEKISLSSGLRLDITPEFNEPIVEGSVAFSLGGKNYYDRTGNLYYDLDITTGNSTRAGSIDYSTGRLILTAWVAAQANTVVTKSLATSLDGYPVDEVTFRVPMSPIRIGSFQISVTPASGNGGQILVSADSSGVISSPEMEGTINYDTGVVRISFGSWVPALGNDTELWYNAAAVRNGMIFKPNPVMASSLRYNAVAYSYLPMDASILKVDPVRLPSDGRVPMIRKGNIAVVHNTQKTTLPNPLTAGTVRDLGRTRLAKVWLEDANGLVVPPSKYSIDKDYGVLTMGSPLDLTGFVQPIKAVHRIEDMSLVTDVDLNGKVTLDKPLSHAYPKDTTYLSTALIIDDLWARVANVFDQLTWSGVWSDSVIGSAATAQYNATDFPITVQNRGSITERFALVFTSSTAFNVIGEHLGQIASGTTNAVCAPWNPNTNTPYFSIPAGGWGTGWATGNVLRFNVYGASAPIWVARTILQSDATVEGDAFSLQLRGNINV